MKRLRSVTCHDCAPKEYRHTPKMTGDYDLDATIMHRRNSDMAQKVTAKMRAKHGGRKYGDLLYG